MSKSKNPALIADCDLRSSVRVLESFLLAKMIAKVLLFFSSKSSTFPCRILVIHDKIHKNLGK
jgi:hypothetical protein